VRARIPDMFFPAAGLGRVPTSDMPSETVVRPKHGNRSRQPRYQIQLSPSGFLLFRRWGGEPAESLHQHGEQTDAGQDRLKLVAWCRAEYLRKREMLDISLRRR